MTLLGAMLLEVPSIYAQEVSVTTSPVIEPKSSPQADNTLNISPKPSVTENKPAEKIIIGRVEWIEIAELKLKLKARIDTGAKTTSMHALEIVEIQKNGENWVKFKTLDEEQKPHVLERKVHAMMKILSPNGISMKRYVIREKVRLGMTVKEVSVNLNNREKMDYQFLIGRNFLMGQFLVDVAKSHVMGE